MRRDYRVLYKWCDRHYFTTMNHYSAANAVAAASVMIMKGAQIYGVEAA